MSSEEFTKITYKRKNKKQQLSITTNLANLTLDSQDFEKTKAIRLILEAKDTILASNYYSNLQASINEALNKISNNSSASTNAHNLRKLKEIVCFGIGHISNSFISQHQFALILIFKEIHKVKTVKCCDPIFSANDINILNHFNIEIIQENIEAKYKATDLTLFYLPHCPKQLSNNLLWSNWLKTSLKNCIILSNSFQSLIDNNSHRELVDNAEYVLKISEFIEEIPVVNNFQFYEVFNDSAIHFVCNLELIEDSFWLNVKEPTYLKDVEYIEKKN